jgi:hypothetical protein
MPVNAPAGCRYSLKLRDLAGTGAKFMERATPHRPNLPGAGSWLACAVAALLLSGCAELLPKASSQIASPWHSYEEALAAIQRIAPYRSTAADLKTLGFDPFVTPNVQLLNFSDIVLRFPVSANLPLDRLDKGLRECFEAGKECLGYSVNIRETKRDRVGDFWLDSLQFYRVTDVKGWSFNALVLLVDERVVYVIHGGQPVILEKETNKQPLGPLQGWGDIVPGLFK